MPWKRMTRFTFMDILLSYDFNPICHKIFVKIYCWFGGRDGFNWWGIWYLCLWNITSTMTQILYVLRGYLVSNISVYAYNGKNLELRVLLNVNILWGYIKFRIIYWILLWFSMVWTHSNYKYCCTFLSMWWIFY